MDIVKEIVTYMDGPAVVHTCPVIKQWTSAGGTHRS